MIAIDTNILVYAHRSDSPFHVGAKGAVKRLAEGADPWGLPWPCVHEFLANVTHPRIYKRPTAMERALGQVTEWLRSPSIVTLSEDERYWGVLETLLKGARISGPKVHDARIAALCIRHGVSELWTADRDFSRFKPLRAHNPLAP